MQPPDQRAFLTDTENGTFRIGVAEGIWGFADKSLLPPDLSWPRVVLWVAAEARNNSPDRFYICLDCQNYPMEPPTGNFWDIETKGPLVPAKRPKGKGNVAKVFRTDWEQGRAFYHPYDRFASNSHSNWKQKYPHLIWGRKHTIVDLLDVIHHLLNCSDYTGV
jgi:hypothetical protein